MTLEKGPYTLKFDIVIPTPKGKVYCMKFKRANKETKVTEKISSSELAPCYQQEEEVTEAGESENTANKTAEEEADVSNQKNFVAKTY